MSKISHPLLVVGIGASAGGLDALKQFFKTVPKDVPLAFIVVQHLDPNHKSMMVDILERHADFSFSQAQNNQIIHAGHAYLIPPNSNIEVVGHRIRIVKPQHQLGSRLAIDHLFRSMAQQYKSKAVGIVLSGSGSDGTTGLRALKAGGGLAIVQTPETAEYPSMPNSAIDAGVVDQVLNIEDMIQLLQEYANHPYHELDPKDPLDESDKTLQIVSSLLKAHENFVLDQYKETTVHRRLYRRMSLTDKQDEASYIELLRNSQTERKMLMRDLLINVTDFFRDKEAFAILESDVVSKIVSEVEEGSDIRVWVAGCSTGEEAYTVAILFKEEIEKSGKDLAIKIFATDVDDGVVAKARLGVFSVSIASELPEEYLKKYFHPKEDGYFVVNSELRDCISFATQNVYTDPPFSKLHLVCCRNLLIYLRSSVQQKVLGSFYFALLPNGYLFLGSSETIGDHKKQFTPVSHKWRIFSRIERQGQTVRSTHTPSFFNRTIKTTVGRNTQAATNNQLGKSQLALLSALKPSVLLDENHRVNYIHGEVNEFLQLPQGQAEFNFFAMLDADMCTRLRSGIFKAKKSKQQVIVNQSNFSDSVNQDKTFNRATITPVIEDSALQGSVVVTFEKVTLSDNDKNGYQLGHDDGEDHYNMFDAMEQELKDTREELQNTLEELETSTEELKASHEEALSTNEELQSSNEELEASTEELRSLNEELTTVNAQLKDKIEQLSSTHNDINNFLASTNLATVFLTNELKVKRFTPAAERLLKLGSSDINRPLEEISQQFVDQNTLNDAIQVLDSLESSEREIRVGNRWYLQRILPYQTEDRRVEGVVLTFNDINSLKVAVAGLQTSGQQHAIISKLGIEALSTDNIDNLTDRLVREVAHTLNADFAKVLKYLPNENSLLLKAGVGWDAGLVGNTRVQTGNCSQAGFALTSTEPVIVDDLATERRFTGPNLLTEHKVVSGISCVIENGEYPYGVLSIHTKTKQHFTKDDANFLRSAANILSIAIQRTSIEQKLRDNENRLRIAKDSNRLGSFEFMMQTGAVDWDDLLLEIWGLDRHEINIETFAEQIHEDDIAQVNHAIELAGRPDGNGHYQVTYRVINKKTAKVTWIEATGQVTFVNNKAHKMIGMVIDITERKNLESSLRRAVTELQNANEKKNEFLATLGHEIRNPLAAISSGLLIIDQDTSHLPKAVKMIESNVSVISSLLDDLLDLTRIEEGKIQLNKQVIDVNQLLQEIYDSFLLKFEQKQQHHTLLLPKETIVARIDKIRMQQTIVNVINNAFKFTPDLGQIKIELMRLNDECIINIRDNGMGIETAMRDKIFEPFEQINHNLYTDNAGLGIGLSLVKQFMTLHGGSVHVESNGLGAGSNFILRFPIADVSLAEKAEQKKDFHRSKVASKVELYKNLKVLVVDDNEDAAYGLSMILELKGCEVVACIDGKSAISTYNSFKPNVLILDIGLPDMTGYNLLAALKSQKLHSNLLSIALTGFGHKDAQARSKEAGFDHHMTKPAKMDDLLNIITSYAKNITTLL